MRVDVHGIPKGEVGFGSARHDPAEKNVSVSLVTLDGLLPARAIAGARVWTHCKAKMPPIF